MPPSLADQLLDAQVSWLVGQLTGPELPDLVARDVDALLDVGTRIDVGTLVDADDVKKLVRLIVTAVPPSTAASTLVGEAADVAWAGPTEPFALSDLIDRENVEGLVDEALAMTDVVAAFLDSIAESPLVATLAARFVGRIVNDVVAANRAVAEKIPGVGSLMSLGASVGGKVIGAADKQFEQLLGDTAGKSAAFAVKRLNKVVVETMKDPTAREAALQVFDLYADEPLPQLKSLGTKKDLHRVAGLLQDIVIAGAPTDPVTSLADALVDGFFRVYGEHPVSSLIEDLGLTRDDIVEHALVAVPRVLAAAHATGDLEALLRSRLEPFFASPEVAAILG